MIRRKLQKGDFLLEDCGYDIVAQRTYRILGLNTGTLHITRNVIDAGPDDYLRYTPDKIGADDHLKGPW